MVIPAFVPATTISRLAASLCSKLGLTRYFPSTSATLTAAMGPAKGMSEIWTAALAAFTATMSGGLIWSVEMTVGTTWISLPKDLSKRGRMGLSMILEIRISLSLGLVSRLMKPPGILPRIVIFVVFDGEGHEIQALGDLVGAQAVAMTAERHRCEHRPAGLFGHAPGFEHQVS